MRVIANWKMHKTAEEARAFIETLRSKISPGRHVGIAPSFTSLPAALDAALGTDIEIGAQNMHSEREGAFTGEVSAPMLKELGVGFVILGHSERRQHCSETDPLIRKKILLAYAEGLTPVLCIGESGLEREEGREKEVLHRQLEGCLHAVSAEALLRLQIAYEPVWAIGTGKTATPDIARAMHGQIRTYLEGRMGKESARKVPLLYGGSVKRETLPLFSQVKEIDGVLVGGASLDVQTLIDMVNGDLS
jgi:triosephosphate isomerase